MAVERLYIDNTYIPLSEGLNPSIDKSITDIEEPQSRKATFSKTVKIPRSKEADKVFNQMFETNIINRTFNVQARADCKYTVDDNTIIDGYCQLKELSVNDFNDITYDVVMYSESANFFSAIKDKYLTDLYATVGLFEGLDKYDHQFTEEIQQMSWATQVWYNGGFIPFDYGTGYVYPLIDYGLTSDATNFAYNQIGCAIYVREYLRKIIDYAGFEYDSTFIDGTVCERLIIPSSPTNYSLTSAQITNMQFVANTPQFASNSTTTTANLQKNANGSDDQLIFTNDSVAPGADPGLNYNPVTGLFTCVTAGFYDFNLLCDLTVEFTPDTANNVKTRCEVDGFILLKHIPNGSAVETQINATPFYITYDDSAGFISGVRTTQSSPTYPETDYLESKSWSIVPNAPLVARPETVPNRYHLVANNIYMAAGDKIKAYHKTGVFAKKVGVFGIASYTTDFFVDNGGTYYTGNAKLKCSVGAFYNKVANTTIAYGNTLTMSRVIPEKVKMIDFFTSILRMFNLWIDVDPLNPYNLIIEQREDYFSTDVLNIHELVDRSKDIIHTPMGALDVKTFNYRFKRDTDYFNTTYVTTYGDDYGNREVDSTNEFYTQDKTTEVIFSPTPVVGLPNSDRVLPTIYQLNDVNFPIVTKHNIRILYYGGLKTCSQAWNHIHYLVGWPFLPLTDTYTTYPYAGHFDDPFNPTLDINFGLVEEVYYDDNLQTINTTDNNLVNAYHSNYLGEITDEDSRIVTAYIHITPATYLNFTFDKLYYFDYTYFRLQKISGYNPTSEETTLCIFLKLKSVDLFSSTVIEVDGAPSPFNPNWGGTGVDLTEVSPTKGVRSQMQPDANNYSNKQLKITGEGNVVWTDSKQVEINGDGNLVESHTKNIIIQGDENIIRAGVENVTLINTSGVTVEESNVTYINGKIQGRWVTKTASFTVDETIEGYYIDATAGNVDVTIPTGTEYSYWKFKRIDLTLNYASLNNASDEIDGGRSFILTPLEACDLVWNNDAETYNVL